MTSFQSVRGLSDAEGPDRAVRRQREHDQRRRGEEQSVVQLLLRQNGSDEPVEARAQREKNGDGHGEPRGERRLPDSEGAEQQSRQQRDLGRQPRIGAAASEISDHSQSPDDEHRGEENSLASEREADSPDERSEGERPDAGSRPTGTNAFAPLPLGADQEPDAERDGEADCEGLDARAHRAGASPAARMPPRRSSASSSVATKFSRPYRSSLPARSSASARLRLDARR